MGFFNKFNKRNVGDKAIKKGLPVPPMPKKMAAMPIPPENKKPTTEPTKPIKPVTKDEPKKEQKRVVEKKDEVVLKQSPIITQAQTSAEPTAPKKVSGSEPQKLKELPKPQPALMQKIDTPVTNVPDKLPDLRARSLVFVEEEIPAFLDIQPVVLPNIPGFDVVEAKENENTVPTIYIRTDQYGHMLTNIATMKNYVLDSTEVISSLKNLKKNSDIEHKRYGDALEDIQRKLIYVDNVLFQTMRD